MTTSSNSRQKNYFSEELGAEDFDLSFNKLFNQIRKNSISKYLTAENTQRFKHGSGYVHPAAPEVLVGSMKKHSTETVVSFDKLINHDLTVIDQVLQQAANSLEVQFVEMMFSSVSAAAESVGNTVDIKGAGSTCEAFAQMLEKVEFSLDKHGNVILPSMMAGPLAYQSFQKSLAEAPPDFLERIETIKARKTAEAREREVQRKARFVCYGDET